MIPLQWKFLLLSVLVLLAMADKPAGSNKDNAVIHFNSDFYNDMRLEQIILRDRFLDKVLNSTVSGSGIIESYRKEKRYGKDILIVAEDNDPGKKKFEIKYHIYTDRDVDYTNLVSGSIIEFIGILVLYTPLNTARNKFIFDIILDEDQYTIK